MSNVTPDADGGFVAEPQSCPSPATAADKKRRARVRSYNDSSAEVAPIAYLNSRTPVQDPPSTEHQALPVSAVETPDAGRFDASLEAGIRIYDEPNNSNAVSPRPHDQDDHPYQGLKRTNAIVDGLHQELGSVNVLLELQRDLRRVRAATANGAVQPPPSMPKLGSHSEEVLIESLEQLKTHFDKLLQLNLGPLLKIALERHRLNNIVQWYDDAKKEKRRHSLAVIFAKKFMPNVAWDCRHMPKKEQDHHLQATWKSHIRKCRFWSQLVNACGSEATLLLLPRSFSDEQWVCPP